MSKGKKIKDPELTAEQFLKFVEEHTSARMAGFVHPASESGRTRSDWGTSELPLSVADIKIITNRAARAYKSHTWLKAAVEVIRVNVIEKGLKPRPVIKKQNGEINKSLNEEITEQWKRFNDYAFTGNFTFYQKQHTILKSMLVTGACYIIKIASLKDSPFNFSLKLKDNRHLDFTKDTFGENKDKSYVKHGIKYDKDGEPVEYYFKDYKNAIPADRVIAAYFEDLADENIGLSIFLQSLPTIYDIESIIKYQLLSTRLTAGIALWSKTGDAPKVKEMSPLSIMTSESKPEVIEGTSRVNQEIVPLIDTCLTSIASSLGLSKAALMRDTLKESFSGGRLRSLNDELTYETLSKAFCKAALQPVYVWFLSDIIISGKLSVKSTEYTRDKWTYHQAYWQGKLKEYIDPLDQANTDATKIKNRLMSFKDYYQSKGKDWRVELDQIAEEAKYMRDHGLTVDQWGEHVKSNSEKEK